ncbi:MAG: O-antigen ligase family protein [Clostridiales bacterium]|jgi:O-antigen ligase|nr:O-antigen ligase family protein [Clostridiales bacterium]
MTDIMKNSLIYKLGRRVSAQWSRSIIGGAVTRDSGDAVIKNSMIYSAVRRLLTLLRGVCGKIADALDALIENSAVLSFFRAAGRVAAAWFKPSLLCRLIEKLWECQFAFQGLKLYQLLVFLVIFIAPIAPTMVCAGVTAAAFALYAVDCVRRKSFPDTPGAVGFFILLLTVIFGFFAVFSLTPRDSVKIWALYTVFMSAFLLVTSTVTSRERLYKLAAVAVFAGFLVSLYGICQNFFGSNIGHAWLDDAMFDGITMRVYSTLENPNVLGEYLLLVIPVCAALLWTRKTLLSRLYYIGVLGTMLLCMLFTQSRGCWLGLILTAAVFALFVDWRLVALGAIAIFLLPFILPESIITRFTSIGNINDSSTSYRLYIWLGTLNMLKDFGIYGIGLGSGAFNKIYPFYSYSAIIAPHAHNIYLQLLCETGIVGLGAFLLTMAAALKKMLLTAMGGKKRFGGVFAVAVLAGLLGYLLQGAFDYVWYNYRVFLIFWMTIALGAAAGKTLTATPEPQLERNIHADD